MAGMIAQATGVRQHGRHGRQGAAHGASRATTAALCSSRRAGRGHDDDGPASRAATAALCSSQRARGGGRCREGIQGLAGCAGPSICRPRRPRRGAGRQGPPPAGGGREPVAAARPTPDELPGASGTAQARSWPSDNPRQCTTPAPIDAQIDLNARHRPKSALVRASKNRQVYKSGQWAPTRAAWSWSAARAGLGPPFAPPCKRAGCGNVTCQAVTGFQG